MKYQADGVPPHRPGRKIWARPADWQPAPALASRRSLLRAMNVFVLTWLEWYFTVGKFKEEENAETLGLHWAVYKFSKSRGCRRYCLELRLFGRDVTHALISTTASIEFVVIAPIDTTRRYSCHRHGVSTACKPTASGRPLGYRRWFPKTFNVAAPETGSLPT